MFRTVIRRDGCNPLTGKAQYKVSHSYALAGGIERKSVFKFGGKTGYGILTAKRWQVGCFINPRKAMGI